MVAVDCLEELLRFNDELEVLVTLEELVVLELSAMELELSADWLEELTVEFELDEGLTPSKCQ